MSGTVFYSLSSVITFKWIDVHPPHLNLSYVNKVNIRKKYLYLRKASSISRHPLIILKLVTPEQRKI